MSKSEITFQAAVAGLLAGDFSRLAPLFTDDAGQRCAVIEWYKQGLFANEPQALAEALTCACFNGCVSVAETLLNENVDAEAGNGTGMNALHWAADRGQLEVVRLLLQRQMPLETRNMYGGTVLSGTVWAFFHEPRANHLKIIEALLEAGAQADAVEYPTGNVQIDGLLQRYNMNPQR